MSQLSHNPDIGSIRLHGGIEFHTVGFSLLILLTTVFTICIILMVIVIYWENARKKAEGLQLFPRLREAKEEEAEEILEHSKTLWESYKASQDKQSNT